MKSEQAVLPNPCLEEEEEEEVYIILSTDIYVHTRPVSPGFVRQIKPNTCYL
jgi:hypothetical protein